jgi:hypothetical protein
MILRLVSLVLRHGSALALSEAVGRVEGLAHHDPEQGRQLAAASKDQCA